VYENPSTRATDSRTTLFHGSAVLPIEGAPAGTRPPALTGLITK
jgi:hypothetical protein